MTIKEYLSQVYYLDKLIIAKLEQCSRLRELATNVSPTLVTDKIVGGSIENRKENHICNLIDLEMEINADIDRLIDLRKEIAKIIESVEDEKSRLLLTLRYLNCKKWEDVAEIMGYEDVRNVYRVHKNSLNVIECHVPSVI